MQKQSVLADHKKVGQKFIPPWVQSFPNMAEVSYGRDILPEGIWIAVLCDRCGRHRGTQLSLELAQAAAALQSREHFGLCSSFAALTQEQREMLTNELPAREEISDALSPFIRLYPQCPLAFVCSADYSEEGVSETGVQWMKAVVTDVEIRSGEGATAMQAGMIYLEFLTDKLKVSSQTSLANFPEIEKYPHTEKSRRVASSIRASLNGLIGQMVTDEGKWRKYFWNRGLELGECEVYE